MQQTRELIPQIRSERFNSTTTVVRIQGEVVRKSLHLLIALVPLLASVNLSATFALLAVGTIFYALAETSRLQGSPVPLVSDLTLIASRERDRNGFVLGPITLGIGAMLSLLLYPLPAASIAIYALAFGDGFASLVGTTVRGPRLPFLRGKTLAGSLACFTVVFIVTLRITARPVGAALIAGSATLLEAIPTGNFDNVILPFGVGMIAAKILFI
ncbi:MAG: phosphatidate cytidylyltransferase [Spirochaetia bacterium]|jgi:dolichol kinase